MRRFRLLSLWILASATFGCKTIPTDSGLSSLTPEEREACQFEGKRFVLVINPADEFQNTVTLTRQIFVADFADPDTLATPEFLRKNSAKAEECRKYYKRLASQYTEKPAIYGSLATIDGVKTFLRKQSEAIKRQREIWSSEYTDSNSQPEIQVMLLFAGHGQNTTQTTGGGLAMRDGLYPYAEIVTDLYQLLFTKCSQDGLTGTRCDQVKDSERMADELIVLSTNCFSGNLADRLQKSLNSKGYPMLKEGQKSSATRYFFLAASTAEQVSWFYRGESQLVRAVKEAAIDKNGSRFDGDPWSVSLFDLRQYILETSLGRHFDHSVSMIEGNLIRPLVCGQGRQQTMSQLLQYKTFFEGKLFQAPVETLTSTELLSPGGTTATTQSQLSISTPIIESNLSDELLKQYWLATTAGPDSQTEDGKGVERRFTENRDAMRAEIMRRVKIVQAVFDKLRQSSEAQPLPQNNGGSSTRTTNQPPAGNSLNPGMNGPGSTNHNEASARLPQLAPVQMNFPDPDTAAYYKNVWDSCHGAGAGGATNSQDPFETVR